MKTTLGHLTLLLVVSVTVMFSSLGATRLWDRDEPRNAGCAEEMLQRGDLVVPMFNDQLRDAKPVLLYWLIISAYQWFGVNEFAARFPSATLAVGTVMGTYAIGRRLFNPTVALWGAIILTTSTMFAVAGRAATPDSPLVFCSTLALMLFVLGAFRARREGSHVEAAPVLRREGHWFPQNRLLVASMYGVMGVGILAKGPIGLILPTAVIGMFLLVMRLPNCGRDEQPVPGTLLSTLLSITRRVCVPVWHTFAPRHFLQTCWYMRPLTAIAAALLVAGPWFVLVGMRTDGDFLTGFFIREHLGRATQSFENHKGSVLFYPLVILICFFPWSIFAAPTVMEVITRIRKRDGWHPGYIFLACWVGVYVAIFTLAETKLPSYVTPCYPALALLTGCFVHYWIRGTHVSPSFLPTVAIAVLGLVGLAITVGLPLAANVFLPGEEWLGAIGLIPMVGGIAALLLMRRGRRRSMGIAVAVSATAFIVAIFSGLLVRVDGHQENHRLLDAVASHSENPSIASFRCLESSWIFYAKRPILELRDITQTPGVKSAGPPGREKPWRPISATSVLTFFETHEQPYLITKKQYLRELQSQLPPDVQVLAEARYFLKSDTLVVLGHAADSDNSGSNASLTGVLQPQDAVVTR